MKIDQIKVAERLRDEQFRRYAETGINKALAPVPYILQIVHPMRRKMIQKMNEYHGNNRSNNLYRDYIRSLIRLTLDDIIFFMILGIFLLVCPMRIPSYLVYWYSGNLKRALNFHIIEETGHQKILQIARDKRSEIVRNMYDCTANEIKSFFYILFGCTIMTRYPSIFYLLKESVKEKLQRHQQRNYTFCYFEQSERTIKEAKNIFHKAKEDYKSLFTLFVILCGVYHVKNTYRRCATILWFKFRATGIYKAWISFTLWWKVKDQRKSGGEKTENKLKVLGYANLKVLGDFLTPKDKINLMMTSKENQHFLMQTSTIWLHYYRENISRDPISGQTRAEIPQNCLEHYRLEISKKFDSERDFNLGIRLILKEEAIKSILTLPELKAFPYRMINRAREICGAEFQTVITLLPTYSAPFEEYEN